MDRSLKPILVMVFIVASICAGHAQPADRGPMGWGPGMMGPGMMGGLGYGRMCSPSAAGFADWRLDRLERTLNLTPAQLEAFAALKKTSTEASEAMRTGCPRGFVNSAPERMKAMEERMDAMLRALKSVRPVLEAFYATLSDEQKAIFDRHQYRRARR
jgi:hypothetical protein